MKAGVLITVILTAAGVIGFVFADHTGLTTAPPVTAQPTQRAPSEPAALKLAATPAAIAPPAAEPNTLAAVAERLERQQALLSERLDDLTKRLAVLASLQRETVDVTESEIELAEPEDELTADPNTQLRVWDDDFMTEQRHDNWAQVMEQEAGDTLLASELTADNLLDVECRATVCRALLQFDSLGGLNDSLEVIPAVLEDFSDIAIIPMEETTEVAVYFSDSLE